MRGLRPKFPAHAPPAYIQLAQSCWSGSPQLRPTFEEGLVMLNNMLIVSADGERKGGGGEGRNTTLTSLSDDRDVYAPMTPLTLSP